MRDEFDLERARYHKVILMTDADVDGAHIRTLVLTLLFREMQELIEAGYVYIAKPPLYKLKQGRNERYIEKESELEEVLLSDKFERIEIFDRYDKQFKLTEARWQKYAAPAASSTRAGRARCAPSTATRSSRFLEESSLLDEQVDDRRRGGPRCSSARPRTARSTTTRAARPGRDARCACARSRRRPAWRATHRIRRELFESPEYRSFLRVHQALVELAGAPPFTVTLGGPDRGGAVVRGAAQRGARGRRRQQGVGLNRFKGLGEMNAEQLRETTMDPETRTLQQVSHRGRRRGRAALLDADGRRRRAAPRFIEDNALAAQIDV